jgi:hypothetical protein
LPKSEFTLTEWIDYVDSHPEYLMIPKGDELPIRVSLTGGSGPARVWGHVKAIL